MALKLPMTGRPKDSGGSSAETSSLLHVVYPGLNLLKGHAGINLKRVAQQLMGDEKIAREIMEYLREHPYSGDSVEGICKWWLMRQRISESLDAVQQTLEHLLRTGFLYERKMADGRTVYFAARRPNATAPIDDENSFEGGLVH